jgi:hypothetical protein
LLTAYNTQVRNLLQLPGAQSTSLYTDANITAWINIARGQLAGRSGCIRNMGTIPTISGQQSYNFSGINTGTGNGIQGIINVRSMSYNLGGGQKFIPMRSFEWFTLYQLNNAVPVAGPPQNWSQFAQGAAPPPGGSALGGSFYLDPPPDTVYTLNCNATCYPIPLVDDTTIEAIPYLWTDAVPFFAAYYALMSAQTNARMADALQYYKMFNEFMDEARKASNASTNRWMYDQAGDPVQAAKMGIQQSGAK